MIYTNIYGFEEKGRKIHADICMETKTERKYMTLVLDMRTMGIKRGMEYDMELSKDIMRESYKLYDEIGVIPDAVELIDRVQRHYYAQR